MVHEMCATYGLGTPRQYLQTVTYGDAYKDVLAYAAFRSIQPTDAHLLDVHLAALRMVDMDPKKVKFRDLLISPRSGAVPEKPKGESESQVGANLNLFAQMSGATLPKMKK